MLVILRTFILFIICAASTIFAVNVTLAAPISPSSAPAASGYTLSDIWYRLTTNATATSGVHDFTPTTTPRSTFPSLSEIYSSIPTINPAKLLSDTSYLGVTGTIAIKTGNTVSASSSAQGTAIVLTVPAGYYSGVASVTVSTTSPNLLSSNINIGTNIFGIIGTLIGATGNASSSDVFSGKTFSTSTVSGATGTLNLACNTSTFDGTANKVSDTYDGTGDGTNRWCVKETGDAAAGDIASGKKAWVDGVEVSGSLTTVDYSTWKLQTKDDWVNSAGTVGEYTAEEGTWQTVAGSPFSGYDAIDFAPDTGGQLDLLSGTVKQDMRTGLWWSDVSAVGASASSTSNVFTLSADGSRPTGGNAISFCEALNSYNSGAGFAGHNDWYLPTQKQLMQAYINGSANNLPSPGFYFWSSTEYYANAAYAWFTLLFNGYTIITTKVNSYSIRCVRP